MSEWVRRKDADWRGYVSCVTCGTTRIWNDRMDAGHWIHDKLDYEEMNIHPQCKECNYKFNWKKVMPKYGRYMARNYGATQMERLEKLAWEKGNNYTRQELELIIGDLQTKISNLEN